MTPCLMLFSGIPHLAIFLSDPGIPGVRSMGRECLSLTDLVETYTSYTSFRLYTSYRLYTEKVTRVAHLVDNFATYASDSTWW